MTTSPNPTYLNFDLLITRVGDAYRAYVVDAPGGDADVTFEMPFAPDELVRLVHGEGGSVERAELLAVLEVGQNPWVDE